MTGSWVAGFWSFMVVYLSAGHLLVVWAAGDGPERTVRVNPATASCTRPGSAPVTVRTSRPSSYAAVTWALARPAAVSASVMADDDRTLHARVLRDLADRGLKRPEHDVDAGLDVGIVAAELSDRRLGAQQCDAASGHNAFLDGRLGCVHRVVDAVLLLLDLDLGRTADADDRHAARQLGEALLQLFLVIVGGRLLDLRLDLGDWPSMSFFDPAPSMIVVFSFSIRTRLARPSM